MAESTTESTGDLFIHLYLDEDVIEDLAPALRWRGYITQSTVEAKRTGLSDELQLEYATARRMAILTYNGRDYLELAELWANSGHEHAGIIISQQFRREHFGDLLRQVLRLLDSLSADELYNQVVYLQRFKR